MLCHTIVLLRIAAHDDKYCLHGSGIPITELKPQQSHCHSGREEGNQLAIYADPGDWRIPCLLAAARRDDPMKDSRTSYHREGDGPLVFNGQNTKFGPGYIYVLPKTSFFYMKDEFMSRVPVMPHLVIPVPAEIVWRLPDTEIQLD